MAHVHKLLENLRTVLEVRSGPKDQPLEFPMGVVTHDKLWDIGYEAAQQVSKIVEKQLGMAPAVTALDDIADVIYDIMSEQAKQEAK